jgi:hypothetical protein
MLFQLPNYNKMGEQTRTRMVAANKRISVGYFTGLVPIAHKERYGCHGNWKVM